MKGNPETAEGNSYYKHAAGDQEKKDETTYQIERYTNTFRIDKNVKTVSLMRESAKFWGLNLKNLRLVDFHTKAVKTRNSQLISDALKRPRSKIYNLRHDDACREPAGH
jgi:hypothetical protein